jgi:putative DNA methylase
MTKPKKLIEVAMPIKEISAESVRDKSIRHGHISTLHLWWARRPLPVCRAVVFASLVPDPLDENCPQAFHDAVEILLGSAKKTLREQGFAPDPYKPYDDIPYTAAIDKMEDNSRNRLLMFIGKYSDEFSRNEKAGKTTASNKQLSDASLIKWDNKNSENIIGKARKLIWVAHNSTTKGSSLSAKELLSEFDKFYSGIKAAEDKLYSIKDRHTSTKEVEAAELNLKNSIDAFLDKMPKVFDPFAGGGAIPLEAARLGCRSFGNDINPVAHIIQKGSLEFPQKYGKPIIYSKAEFLKIYGQEEWKKLTNDNLIFENGEAVGVKVSNRLSFDISFYARKVLAIAEKQIGYLYPSDKSDIKPVGYYWARVGTCSNPSCKAKIPLLRQMNLVSKSEKKVHLKPIITGNKIEFEIKKGSTSEESWIARGNLVCPCCGNTTENSVLKQQFIDGKIEDRLLVVIYESKEGKSYRLPNKEDLESLNNLPEISFRPSEKLPITYSKAMAFCLWNFNTWGDIYTNRELIFLNKFVEVINDLVSFENEDYRIAVKAYLAILFDRIASRQTSFGLWNTKAETIEHPFGKQAIQMVFDYPESNPFSDSGGGTLSQLDWVVRYIESESPLFNYTICVNASSGDKNQFAKKYIDAVITDPPYYDAVAYADLSDFFYVWLKKILGGDLPLNFATPQTPKSEECTALKHHREEDSNKAKLHFEKKILQIFDAIEHQTSDIVSIMYAHQSTEAWTTLCNSILGARMNITGSWAIDTERTSGTKVNKAFLSSSVTVSCQPSQRQGIGDYKEVKKTVEKTVAKEVEDLYRLGFRGADLLTACFGQAVSEFGKYEKVEKADGSEVNVGDLLEMARESAFNALLKGFVGDDFTKFYIGWLQLYGFIESEFGDLNTLVKVGLSVETNDLFKEHILIKNGNKQTLGTFEERIKANKNIGDRANNFLIDLVHRAMALYKGNNRSALLQYIGKVAAQPESNFWRVVTSLCEVLPAGSEDHKQALGLLTNKDSLIRESKTVQSATTTQTNLFES